MANTFTLIASTTVGSGGTTSVSFASIPQTYTDLKLVGSARGSRASQYIINLSITFNGSSSSYSSRILYGDGSTATSANGSSQSGWLYSYGNADSSTANTFSNFEIYVPNYTSANNKSISADSVIESNNASYTLSDLLGAGLWANTSAITSLAVGIDNGTSINQYSTFYLYGIKNS